MATGRLPAAGWRREIRKKVINIMYMIYIRKPVAAIRRYAQTLKIRAWYHRGVDDQVNSAFIVRRKKRTRRLIIVGTFIFILMAVPLGWFGVMTYGYYKMIASGEMTTLEDLRLKSSIAKIATNANVTEEDLRRLKPNGLAPELGSRTARIEIIEFMDYQCPFCEQNASVVRRVMYEMGDRVHFMIRDYPVIDPMGRSRSVALAANCVLEQGQEEYWRFHDLFFTDISKASTDELRAFASQAGADISEYDTCVEERRYDLKIDNDIEVGKQAGVEGTPTFFVYGAKYQGYLDDKVLSQIINYYLEALPQ